jgi:hypothetical protein
LSKFVREDKKTVKISSANPLFGRRKLSALISHFLGQGETGRGPTEPGLATSHYRGNPKRTKGGHNVTIELVDGHAHVKGCREVKRVERRGSGRPYDPKRLRILSAQSLEHNDFLGGKRIPPSETGSSESAFEEAL